MRHRSVASIVCASALILVLTGCMNAHLSAQSSESRTNGGSIAPSAAPTLVPSRLSSRDNPQSSDGTPISSQSVEEAFATLKEHVASHKGTLWVHVLDVPTGAVLLSEGATTPQTPASVTKVLTAATALNHLDENATLATGTSLENTALYLWGEGDLLLGAEEPTRHINGRANLKTLAAQSAQALKNQGITQVTLNWAPHPFDGPSLLPAWETQEVTEHEGHVAAYAIDSGKTDASSFVSDPEKSVAQAFVAALADNGINTTLGKQKAAPDTAKEIARVSSASIGEQIRYMLYHSDNTLADQLCRLSAKAAGNNTSYEGATTTIKKTLTDLDIDPQGIRLEDCSGLSSNDRIEPRILAQTLHAALTSQRADLRDLIRDLPWAGAQGTMARRYFDGTAIGNVQGKTGSLGDVTSLAGIVRSASGRELIYAVGISGTDEGAAYFFRPAIDEFIQNLTTIDK